MRECVARAAEASGPCFGSRCGTGSRDKPAQRAHVPARGVVSVPRVSLVRPGRFCERGAVGAWVCARGRGLGDATCRSRVSSPLRDPRGSSVRNPRVLICAKRISEVPSKATLAVAKGAVGSALPRGVGDRDAGLRLSRKWNDSLTSRRRDPD